MPPATRSPVIVSDYEERKETTYEPGDPHRPRPHLQPLPQGSRHPVGRPAAPTPSVVPSSRRAQTHRPRLRRTKGVIKMFSKRNVLTSCRNLRTRTSEIGVGAILGIPMAAPICATTPLLAWHRRRPHLARHRSLRLGQHRRHRRCRRPLKPWRSRQPTPPAVANSRRLCFPSDRGSTTLEPHCQVLDGA